MSVRNDLLDGLRDALLEINTGNGYDTTVKTVTRDAIVFGALNESQTPALWIPAGGSEVRLDPIGTNQRRMMTIPICGKVDKRQSVAVFYESFLADVRKCLHAADLGTYFIDLQVGNLEEAVGGDTVEFMQDVEIRYYYPEASP